MKRKIGTKGFTLTEIMIVVSIAGILATMGAAGFMRYQKIARQKEAKVLLTNLYGQMTMFQSTWLDYWGRWLDITYAPSGTLGYNVGFSQEGPAVADLNKFY